MDDKYWPYVDFADHFETLSHDSERLLRQLNVWHVYGNNGWVSINNKSGNNNIITIPDDVYIFAPNQSRGRAHATSSSINLKEYITTYEMEQQIESYFADDYNHPILNFTLHRIHNS
jgi:hypothetical protein